jgi:predicted MFS family arabinose efflux permease
MFLIIGIGGISSWWGGVLSQRIGSERVAFYALAISGTCCLLSPFLWQATFVVFVIFLCCWSMAVIADSPQFSTLVAQHASPPIRGSAISVVTCIGFSITIASIQLLNSLADVIPHYLCWLLAPGPILGVIFLRSK